jgi:hypothetical protein
VAPGASWVPLPCLAYRAEARSPTSRPDVSWTYVRAIHLPPPIQIRRMALEYTPQACEVSA